MEEFTSSGTESFLKIVGHTMGTHFDYVDGITYHLVIGHLEGKDENTKEEHYHAMFTCQSGKVCTKGKLRDVFRHYGMPLNESAYIRELQSTVAKYMAYIMKNDPAIRPLNVDDVLEQTMASLVKNNSNITKQTFIDEILDVHGAHWYSKNKATVDVYTNNIRLFDGARIIRSVVDPDKILKRTGDIVAAFHATVLANLKQYGIVCTHEALTDVSNEAIANYMTIVSLIPYIYQRSEDIDNIPAIYLWGEAGAGKTFMYQCGKSYKYLANDAQGVGRFKLDGTEAAILMDDIKAESIDADTNLSTIRTIALGNASRIKVHSSTKSIQAFMVITSNDKPVYLDSKYDTVQALAWKRRFMTLHMTRNNFEDFNHSSGNEFDYKNVQLYVNKFICKLAKELADMDNTKKMLTTIKNYLKSCYAVKEQEEAKLKEEADVQEAIDAIALDEANKEEKEIIESSLEAQNDALYRKLQTVKRRLNFDDVTEPDNKKTLFEHVVDKLQEK